MSQPAANTLLERRFAARSEVLRDIRDAVRDAVARAGCPEEATEHVVLAIDEACQNIIRYAYCDGAQGDIEVGIELEGEDLVVSLRDFAPAVDPDCLNRSRDLDDVRPGGLGTHFIRELMDEAAFVPPPSGVGNLLRLVKRVGKGR